jgi:large subunit ribosomal protein L4
VDTLTFEKPKTKDFINVLNNLKIERSCLVAIGDYDNKLYQSARNVPRVAVRPVAELNAGDICSYRKMLFTKEAFLSILKTEDRGQKPALSEVEETEDRIQNSYS